jgi:hypothetical protein
MTSEQVRDLRDLTRAAGIKPTTTRIQGSTHPVLAELAPGVRVLSEPILAAAPTERPAKQGSGGGGRNRRRRSSGQGRQSSGQSGQQPGQRSGQRSGQGSGQPSARTQGGAPQSGGRRRSSAARASSSGSHSAASFSSGRR